MKKLLLAALGLLSLSSCSTHLTDLTIITNKNIELEKINIDRAPQRKNVIGEDSKWVVLFIPLGLPKLREAVNDTLQKGQGDVIIDASVYANDWWFFIGKISLEVRGTVVDTKGGKR